MELTTVGEELVGNISNHVAQDRYLVVKESEPKNWDKRLVASTVATACGLSLADYIRVERGYDLRQLPRCLLVVNMLPPFDL